MKRVIEINEEVYEEVTCDEGCGLNELTRIIAKSIPLNEVLDKMSEEVQRIRAPRCTYAGNDYFKGREDTVSRVLDIINKYRK